MALYEAYVDGASRGQGANGQDGGDAAAAVMITKNGKNIGQYARLLGYRTNTEAEYEAVLLAAMLCWAGDLRDPIIYSDSQPVVNQINGAYACDNARLRPLWISFHEIAEVFPMRVLHVPRRHVAVADLLAKQILDQYLIGGRLDEGKKGKKR